MPVALCDKFRCPGMPFGSGTGDDEQFSSPLISSSPTAASGLASNMFDKLKGASTGLREKLAESQLKDSVVALGDRVGSELR